MNSFVFMGKRVFYSQERAESERAVLISVMQEKIAALPWLFARVLLPGMGLLTLDTVQVCIRWSWNISWFPGFTVVTQRYSRTPVVFAIFPEREKWFMAVWDLRLTSVICEFHAWMWMCDLDLHFWRRWQTLGSLSHWLRCAKNEVCALKLCKVEIPSENAKWGEQFLWDEVNRPERPLRQ